MTTVLTGIRPSGQVHLGNYLGMLKPAIARQEGNQCLFFIADLHAFTTMKDCEKRYQYTLELVATWLSLGVDVSQHILFAQSQVPDVCELTWHLGTATNYGLLEKAHAFKDSRQNHVDINGATFFYPVLMAADILLYDTDIVPVGKDQKQHVEIARDIAIAFNALYGEGLLKLPEVSIEEAVMTVPGLDGRKMSKSYNNTIPLFVEDKELKKIVLSIKTDSAPLEEAATLDGSLLNDYINLFCSSAQRQEISDLLKTPTYGWGHSKLALFEVINEYLRPYREKYNDLMNNQDFLLDTLADGGRRAQERASVVLSRIRKALKTDWQ